MKSLVLVCLTISLFTCVTSCTNKSFDKLYPSTATCDTTTIMYSRDIVPIVVANCYGAGTSCHNTSGISGFDYTTYAGIVVNIMDGALLTDINFTPTRGHNNMPKDANKLSQCDIDKFTRWVNEGYPNN